MLKLGGRCIVRKSRPSLNLGSCPLGAHPQNVALGYDVGKISTGCLVSKLFHKLIRAHKYFSTCSLLLFYFTRNHA